MELLINRDSVCMGDDMDDHQISLTVEDSSSFTSIIEELKRIKFFPSIDGNNVVWVLIYSNDDLVSYVTKTNSIYSRYVFSEPTILNSMNRGNSDNRINFRYFTSPLKRAEYIFKWFNDQKFHIWHEGFMSEYETYKIASKQESLWLSEIT